MLSTTLYWVALRQRRFAQIMIYYFSDKRRKFKIYVVYLIIFIFSLLILMNPRKRPSSQFKDKERSVDLKLVSRILNLKCIAEGSRGGGCKSNSDEPSFGKEPTKALAGLLYYPFLAV